MALVVKKVDGLNVIEITEKFAFEDFEKAKQVLNSLVEMKDLYGNYHQLMQKKKLLDIKSEITQMSELILKTMEGELDGQNNNRTTKQN